MNKKAHSGLATTFRDDEVSLVCQLIEKLLSGADVRMLTRQTQFASVAGKFQRMREKSRRLRGGE
jgi:hypothetical protein